VNLTLRRCGSGTLIGTLDAGGTFNVEVAGTAPATYACRIHPEMTRTIVVG